MTEPVDVNNSDNVVKIEDKSFDAPQKEIKDYNDESYTKKYDLEHRNDDDKTKDIVIVYTVTFSEDKGGDVFSSVVTNSDKNKVEITEITVEIVKKDGSPNEKHDITNPSNDDDNELIKSFIPASSENKYISLVEIIITVTLKPKDDKVDDFKLPQLESTACYEPKEVTTSKTTGVPSTTKPSETTITTPEQGTTKQTTSPVESCENGDIVGVKCDEQRYCHNGTFVRLFDCSEWTDWSSCPNECDSNAFVYKTRDCNIPTGLSSLSVYNNLYCEETLSEKCSKYPCKVDCVVHEWSEWSECNAPCGEAQFQTRYRSFTPPLNDGEDCNTHFIETQPCNVIKDCHICNGSNMIYSECEKSCQFTCSDLYRDSNSCEDKCNTGCVCKYPLVYQDGECVNRSECKCLFNAHYLDGAENMDSEQVDNLLLNMSLVDHNVENIDFVEIQPESHYVFNCLNCSCMEGVVNCTKLSCTTPPTDEPCGDWLPWSNCLFSVGQSASITTRTRNCSDSSKPTVQTQACDETPCRVTDTAIRKLFNHPRYTNLWIEKDGKHGLTDPSETVHSNTNLNPGAILYTECAFIQCLSNELVLFPDTSCPMNCVWSEWVVQTPCDAVCGKGWITYQRHVDKPAEGGGLDCDPKDFFKTEECDTQIDCLCQTSNWSEFSECSVSCGGGLKTRTRLSNCPDTPLDDKEPCNTDIKCSTDQCEGNKVWYECYNITCPNTCASYQKISECSELECKRGCFCPKDMIEDADSKCVSKEQCSCNINSKKCDLCQDAVCVNGQINCENRPDCDCQFGDWSDWSVCNKECGGGEMTRQRNKLVESRGAGLACNGLDEERKPCNDKDCPSCIVKETSYEISEKIYPRSPCETCFCQVNGSVTCNTNTNRSAPSWSDWNSWSDCSATCNQGVRFRIRSCMDRCTNSSGIKSDQCKGDDTDYIQCNNMNCPPKDCVLLNNWINITECDAKCIKKGIQKGYYKQEAQVIEPATNGGNCKDTQLIECTIFCNETCNDPKKKCATDCKWTEWIPITECNSTCGNGFITYKRDKIPETNGGNPCQGSDTKTEVCLSETDPCCDLNQIFGTQCSLTCEMVVNNTQATNDCIQQCRCKDGMALLDGKCVPISDCYKCVIDGIVYDNSAVVFDNTTCVTKRCINGIETIEPTSVADLNPCTEADEQRSQKNTKVQSAQKCCFITTLPECTVQRVRVDSIFLTNSGPSVNAVCKLTQPINTTRCGGGCQVGSSVSLVGATMGNNDNAYNLLSLTHDCRSCTATKLGEIVTNFVTCSDGRTAQIATKEVLACACDICVDP